MRRPASLAFLALLLLGIACNPVFAQREGRESVAIVEDVSSGVDGIKPLDLVEAGRAIELGQRGRIVLGFLKSCWQDSIDGGRLVVEAQKSRIEGGALSRRRVECDAAGLARMNSEAPAARGGASLVAAALPEADVNLFGLSPIVIAAKPGTLLIERLDTASAPLRLDLAEGKIDLSERNIALQAKGLYRFTSGQTAIVVRIDGLAEAGHAPAVGRLVILR